MWLLSPWLFSYSQQHRPSVLELCPFINHIFLCLQKKQLMNLLNFIQFCHRLWKNSLMLSQSSKVLFDSAWVKSCQLIFGQQFCEPYEHYRITENCIWTLVLFEVTKQGKKQCKWGFCSPLQFLYHCNLPPKLTSKISNQC